MTVIARKVVRSVQSCEFALWYFTPLPRVARAPVAWTRWRSGGDRKNESEPHACSLRSGRFDIFLDL